jgi:hypothetical protein
MRNRVTVVVSAICLSVAVAVGQGGVHFRIRSDDSQALNADSGWRAALDTNGAMEAQKKFRIRFEIEGARAGTERFKLQYNKNGIGWKDAVAYPDDDPNRAPSTPEVWVVTSARYKDGDKTSDLLRRSFAPFVQGTANHTPVTGGIRLQGRHTEVEFTIVIPTFHDGARQNRTGDTFEFRLVHLDNSALGAAVANPRISLAVPAGLIGGTYVESPNRIGPFIDGNGNLYAILEPAETDNVFMVIKSADGGRTWTEQDVAHRPATDDLESVDAVLSGDELHIAHHAGKKVVHHIFRVSTHLDNPDTYRLTDELIAGPITYEEQSVALEVLSGGRLRCIYARTVGGRGRVFYRTKDGRWGAEQSLDDQPTLNLYGVTAVRGASDRVHIVYYSDDGSVYHRSLSSSDVLSKRRILTNAGGVRPSERAPFTPPVYWDDSGDEKIMVGYRKASDGRIYTRVITNNGEPGAEEVASDHAVNNDQAESCQPTANLANDGSRVYLHYADAASEHIFRDVYGPQTGWGADVKEDRVEADLIRGVVLTHSARNGGAKVIGYLFDNGSDGYTGTVRYKEYPIPAR